MTIGDRERLLGRIRQIRRSDATRDRPAVEAAEAPPEHGAADPQAERIGALETRVAHLEQLLEGLQDSVHREFGRHDALIAQLQSQVEPTAMNAALAKDARHRGL